MTDLLRPNKKQTTKKKKAHNTASAGDSFLIASLDGRIMSIARNGLIKGMLGGHCGTRGPVVLHAAENSTTLNTT